MPVIMVRVVAMRVLRRCHDLHRLRLHRSTPSVAAILHANPGPPAFAPFDAAQGDPELVEGINAGLLAAKGPRGTR